MIVDMAIKELKRHRARTILTVVGISIGILLVTALSSFSEGLNEIANERMAFLSGKVLVVQEGIGFNTFTLSEIDEDLENDLIGIPGVQRLAKMVTGSIPEVGMIRGINPDNVDMFDLDISFSDGGMLEDGEDEGLVLGNIYAENTGYKVGDVIEIRGIKYDVIGILDKFNPEADNVVITGFETAQEILHKEDKVTVFMIEPTSVNEAKTIADEINRMYDSVVATTEEGAREQAATFTGQMGMMTFALGSIAAIIAGLGIMNVMYMSVRERRKEIGVMKALGATTNQVILEIVLEAVTISLAGAIIGIILSFIIVDAINTELGTTAAIITLRLLINVTLFAVFLGVFGGILPARQASSLQPAVVLRYE
jgi:putative ABC transport system permease protein